MKALLPIFQRELRNQSRRPGAYALRLAVALPLILVPLAGLFHGDLSGQQALPTAVGILAIVLCTGACMSVCDTIGSDRRQGVLELLRTSPLGPTEVLLGKALCHAFKLLLCLLATLPLFFLMLLDEGVAWQVVALHWLFLFLAAFLGLSTGLHIAADFRTKGLPEANSLVGVFPDLFMLFLLALPFAQNYDPLFLKSDLFFLTPFLLICLSMALVRLFQARSRMLRAWKEAGEPETRPRWKPARAPRPARGLSRLDLSSRSNPCRQLVRALDIELQLIIASLVLVPFNAWLVYLMLVPTERIGAASQFGAASLFVVFVESGLRLVLAIHIPSMLGKGHFGESFAPVLSTPLTDREIASGLRRASQGMVGAWTPLLLLAHLACLLQEAGTRPHSLVLHLGSMLLLLPELRGMQATGASLVLQGVRTWRAGWILLICFCVLPLGAVMAALQFLDPVLALAVATGTRLLVVLLSLRFRSDLLRLRRAFSEPGSTMGILRRRLFLPRFRNL